jgi:hopene-associated glycosyltransferase HpnB
MPQVPMPLGAYDAAGRNVTIGTQARKWPQKMIVGLALVLAPFAIWLYLIGAHGRFWRGLDRDDRGLPPAPASWPAVTIVIPARDEADTIAASLGSLLRQDYSGPLRIILVDDQSSDGTAMVAAQAARGADYPLTIVSGRPLPGGWTGKVWAMEQGLAQADEAGPRYLLFTDADIVYAPHVLRELVARAQSQHLVLASLMVKLRCESLAERTLIPAFVFFFQMLYPFSWVNGPSVKTAAAAGGCMLVDRQALRAAGGIEAIRGALIDDCALGKKLKTVGPIWLGLTQQVRSLRPYRSFGDIRRMVARSAYYQLGYSPLLLAATLAGLSLTFLAPPLITLFAAGIGHLIGGLTWGLMAIAFQPTLRLYRLGPLWGFALPIIAAIYLCFTLDSAYQHRRGRGGLWKGRIHANASGRP